MKSSGVKWNQRSAPLPAAPRAGELLDALTRDALAQLEAGEVIRSVIEFD